ncbi:PREDICTED: SWI/SNF complex subunit SWI3B [Ipomoea nil]|uniref:SWI/SNF complex subunit SWI3B n=1 Tax=Ipomoea nil TaxID=35883 RepID=UPI0009012D5F|nr:PREDICTED: SWI/SNF complex subunit SWI3B [Ipomoea nil]
MATGDTKPSSDTTSQPPAPQLESSPNQTTPVPSRSITTASTPATITSRLPETDVINVPSYSRWFSWNHIHQGEVRFLPEFFDGKFPSKNPRVYKYYRNTIIRTFRENPTRKINFTEVRKTIVGDVGSIRRVFDFLETWGLINYSSSASKTQLKWEDKDTKASLQSSDTNAGSVDVPVPRKRLCSGCKSVCSIACFACDKYDMILCARCYVRGNYRVGLNSSDFRRVELNEEVKTDWTEKETLLLLEAVMHFGDDWKKVAGHVGGRSEKECVSRFIKLPFAQQLAGPPESTEVDSEQLPAKRMRLTPLADASNPIMAQAAFISALAGNEVAEVAARAALKSLSEFGIGKFKGHLKSISASGDKQESHAVEGAFAEAQSQLDSEEEKVESAISEVAVQIQEIEEKISEFDEIESQTEKEWQQLQQLQNLVFADQLNLILSKAATEKGGANLGSNIKTE